MNTITIGKMVEIISGWRKEMNDSSIPAKPNDDLLRSALRDLNRAGLPEGLAAYFIMVSEYLFRVRNVDEVDTYNLLLEIESRLNIIMSQRAVYHLVKALEPSIRQSILEEGRKPIPFQTNLRPALIDLPQNQRTLFPRPNPGEHKKRIELGPMAPKKSGPIPWIAPWVAGSAVRFLLTKRHIKQDFNLAFRVVWALHDAKRFEEVDFRRRDKALQGPALKEFVSWYETRYNLFVKNEKLEQMREPLSPEALVTIEWEPEKPRGFGAALFTHYPDLVYRILETYSSTGKPKKQKVRGKK